VKRLRLPSDGPVAQQDALIGTSLGDFIRYKRKEQGLSLRDFGQIVDISFVHLSDIEQGKRYPSSKALSRIAKAIGVEKERLTKLDKRVSFEELRRFVARSPALASALQATICTLKEGSTTPEAVAELLAGGSAKPH
jgi:transcriptional regulator with XRE-family HTH domain